MLHQHTTHRHALLIALALLLLVSAPASGASASKGDIQGRALAALAADAILCSSHPCLGDGEQEVRELLKDRIVSDEIDYFSDVTVAYPSSKDILTGLVQWDFGGGKLEFVAIRLAQFDSEATLVVQELERALPGCQMEEEEGGIAAWFCSLQHPAMGDVEVGLYMAPGLVWLDIDP